MDCQKDEYIRAIARLGMDYVADLLHRTGHRSTLDVTKEEAKEYWDGLRTGRIKVEE